MAESDLAGPAGSHTSNPVRLMAAAEIRGARVASQDGADLGTVHDVLIAAPEGQIVYVILTYGGIVGIGARTFALPWDVVRFSPEHGAYIVAISEDKLRTAPSFDAASLQDLADPRWAKPLHDYYGSAASWYARTNAT